MHILEYHGLNTQGLSAAYERTLEQLRRGDWRSAEVKKVAPTPYYRAKLDHANRLLFRLMRHGGETCLLALEVIRNHAYDKSRFLRGAVIDEDRIPPLPAPVDPPESLSELPHLPSQRRPFHVLDKVLAFDDAQDAVFRLPPPLVIVGAAGSGKTALTLEKMKQLDGDVLYVTQSAYLAQHARNLYFGCGFEPQEQEPEFLSFRELLETIQVPAGRELAFGDFRDFLRRQAQSVGKRDGHMLYEEFRGVIAGTSRSAPQLSRADYLALGVRQAIFPPEDRDAVYALFERCRAWMAERGLYDSSSVAQTYTPDAQPRYDFAVVDEAQDLTIAQLALILRLLRTPGRFLLSGDANQIVHPNFFSWNKVKTLFYEDEALAASSPIHILRANYRNAAPVNELANRLIKLKQRRFGSIDRESNFLVQSTASRAGGVTLLPDTGALTRELDEKTRQSARFAVIVLREEHKAEARRCFRTPLLFSVQEAKGLEYDHVILYNLVSSARGDYADIAEGVRREDLDGADLAYARARDKADKSLEIYKFFINSLYVAATRAVEQLYVIESDPRHPLLHLLDLEHADQKLELQAQRSDAQEWSLEARKLELQGRQEQADQIRSEVLKLQPVPWPVLDAAAYRELRRRALDPGNVSAKARQQALEYAAFYAEPRLFAQLSGAPPARQTLLRAKANILQKHTSAYGRSNFKDVLALIERHGVDFRSAFNLTPLMLAATAGNAALAEALLARGANADLTDNYGRNAFQLFLQEAALSGSHYPAETFTALYRLLAPDAVSVRVDGRLHKLDQRKIEFVLFNQIAALCKDGLQDPERYRPGVDSGWLMHSLDAFPPVILPPERKRRQYLSGVLARNETNRDYAYNRRVFARLEHGLYALNPCLEVKAGESWVNVCDALNLPLIAEDGDPVSKTFIARLLRRREHTPAASPAPDGAAVTAPSGTESTASQPVAAPPPEVLPARAEP